MTDSPNWSSFVTTANTFPVWAAKPTTEAPPAQSPPLKAPPAWQVGQQVNEWREIAGSSMAAHPPSVDPGRSSNYITSIIDTWNGSSFDTRTDRIYWTASGGHNDSHWNGVMMLDLRLDSPVYNELLTSSVGFTIPTNAARYSDGRPSSSHTYYSCQFVERLNRAMRFGLGAVATSGYGSAVIDAFDPDSRTFDAVGAYPDLPTFGPDMPVCKTDNEDVFIFNYNNAVYKWTRETNTVTTEPSGWPPTTFLKAASVYDPKRKRVFLASSVAAYTYDPATSTFTPRTLTGPFASRVLADQQAMIYEPTLDKFLLRAAGPLGSEAGGAVYVIDPVTFATSQLPTTGGSALPALENGSAGEPYGKLHYSPTLSGIVFTPSYTANAWFLRTA